MSDFINELNRTSISKSNIEKQIQSDFEKCSSVVINKTVDRICKDIKEEIRHKAKTGQYTIKGNKKEITGYESIVTERHSVKLSYEKRKYLSDMSVENISNRFLCNLPKASLSRGNSEDTDDFYFSCAMLKRVRHEPFWSEAYYSYHLTDMFKFIVDKVNKVSAEDNIFVSFSHIALHSGTNSPSHKICDGENDKHIKQRYKYTAVPVIKYTITY